MQECPMSGHPCPEPVYFCDPGSFIICGTVGVTTKRSYSNNNNNNNDKGACKVMKCYPVSVRLQR